MSTAPQMEKLLYSRKDAAYALSISLRGIDRLIASQQLITRRLGGRVVIPAAVLKSFADRVARQDMLLHDGVPVTKRELVVIARNKNSNQHNQDAAHASAPREASRTARSAQETPEEGTRRLRASAR